jgi:hypothetical protein
MAACVYNAKYPVEWSPLISMGKEKGYDISGTFMNEGEGTGKTVRYLSDFFGKTEMYRGGGNRFTFHCYFCRSLESAHNLILKSP